MKKFLITIAILTAGGLSYQTAFAEPTPQVCNYDRPCIWTGTVITGLGYSLYVSVYHGQDGKSILAAFKDNNGNNQVCYCFKNKIGWYFQFDGKKIYFPSDVNFG